MPKLVSLFFLMSSLFVPFTGGQYTPTLLNDASTPVYNGFPVWSPDGDKIAFVSNLGGAWGVWTISTESRELAFVTILSTSLRTLSPDLGWSPSGDYLAFSSDRSGNYDVWTVTVDGITEINLTSAHTGPDRGPSWSPHKDALAYVAVGPTRASDIRLVEIPDLNSTTVVSESNFNFSDITWSPDGSSIAFGAFDVINSQPAGLWRVQIDGTQLLQLTHDRLDSNPDWSPDGASIVIESQPLPNTDLWLMSEDGTNLTRLTANNPHADGSPKWSHDGQKIAFVSNHGIGPDIWLLDMRTMEFKNLTEDLGGYCLNPSWSPNGQQIAFEFHPFEEGTNLPIMSDQSDIWLMDSDGSNKANLTGSTP